MCDPDAIVLVDVLPLLCDIRDDNDTIDDDSDIAIVAIVVVGGIGVDVVDATIILFGRLPFVVLFIES